MQLCQYKSLAVAVMLSGFCVAAHGATISTGFDGANSEADGYKGAIGSGWTTAWSTPVSQSSTVTVAGSVVSSSPLSSGSGKYLDVKISSTADQQGFIARGFNGTSAGVDASQTLTYSFLFRAETTLGSGQYYMIFDRAGGISTGTDSNCTWAIDSATTGKTWRFSNYVSGSNAAVDSGMAVLQDHVYSFVIVSDALKKTYSVTVEDLSATSGTTTFSTGALGYRNTSSSTDGTYLQFGGHSKNSDLSFAIDSLSITSVPEAATLGLLGFGAALLCAKRP